MEGSKKVQKRKEIIEHNLEMKNRLKFCLLLFVVVVTVYVDVALSWNSLECWQCYSSLIL